MKEKKSKRDKAFALADLAERALKEAVREAIKDHKRTGDPIAVWRNGKVAKISAKAIGNQ